MTGQPHEQDKPKNHVLQIRMTDEVDRLIKELMEVMGYRQKTPLIIHALRELHSRNVVNRTT